MLASWRGRTRSVKTLLELGAEPTLTDDRDGSPLVIAAWAGHLAVVKLLLDRIVAIPTQASSASAAAMEASASAAAAASATQASSASQAPVLPAPEPQPYPSGPWETIQLEGGVPMTSSCGGTEASFFFFFFFSASQKRLYLSFPLPLPLSLSRAVRFPLSTSMLTCANDV